VPFIYVPACREILDQAERRQLEPLRGKFDLVVCWCERCYVLGILDEFRIIGTGPRVGL